MKTILINIATVVVALICMSPSALINALHQLSHTEGVLAWPLAGAGVLSVLLAGFSPFAMEQAAKQRNALVFLAALIAFTVCATYNLSSAVGAASTSRAASVGTRGADAAKMMDLNNQIAEAEKSRAELALTAGAQTVDMVDKELQVLQQDARWKRSGECAKVTLEDSRTFCADYAKKLVIRATAAKIEELDKELSSKRPQLSVVRDKGVTSEQPADLQADNIAKALAMIGLTTQAGQIGMGLNIWFALTIEVLGSLGPVVFKHVFATFNGPRQTPEPLRSARPSIVLTVPESPKDVVRLAPLTRKRVQTGGDGTWRVS
jgi:hypothetical protein